MDAEYTLTIYNAITGEITTRPMTEEEIEAMPTTVDTLNKEP
jgi:hypothetical protein